MRRLFGLIILLALLCNTVLAQISFLPSAGECNQPSSAFCLQPSATLRLNLTRLDPSSATSNWDLGGGFGIQIATRGDLNNLDLLGSLKYQVSGGLWWDAVGNLDLLEAYAEIPLDTFRLSIGKRNRYSGPWDDVLIGRLGYWGLYIDSTRHDALSAIPIGFEAAYLPNPGFVGGLVFLGLTFDIFHAGSFVDVIDGPTGLTLVTNPRVGLETDLATLYWQKNRGFWTNLGLPIGKAVSAIAQTPLNLGLLDQTRLEAIAWWNPNWSLLDNNTFIPPTEDRTLYFLGHPQKLLLGLSVSLLDQFRIGVDVSRAPVEAYRFYTQFWLK